MFWLIFLTIHLVTSHEYLNKESQEIISNEYGQKPGSKSTTCPCGWSNKVQGRIVGGRETDINEFPFMAGIAARDEMFIYCGAAIISEYHATTAAHCTNDRKPQSLGLYVGEHDVFNTAETNVTDYIYIKNVIQHPEYNSKPDSQVNDIAILVLERKINFDHLVGPACLPQTSLDLVGNYVRVMGWGHMKYKGRHSKVLRKVDLRVIPLNLCAESLMADISLDKPKQICTFSKKKDACKGDSGGPVVWLDPETNRYTLVGVVSFGSKCATETPGIQTDITKYIDWIKKEVKNSNSDGNVCMKK